MITIPVSRIRRRWLRRTTIAVSMPFVLVMQILLAVFAMIIAIGTVLYTLPSVLWDNIASAVDVWKMP